ncbi:hypothetical protein HYW76_02175 [Candidatus Pacearchaeota archaeon]|nr:hypothetical protein [Candidatus Pacearchaeota archaeon]
MIKKRLVVYPDSEIITDSRGRVIGLTTGYAPLDRFVPQNVKDIRAYAISREGQKITLSRPRYYSKDESGMFVEKLGDGKTDIILNVRDIEKLVNILLNLSGLEIGIFPSR